MIELEEILEHRVEDILNDSALLIPMLKYYSQLYLSGGTPRTCARSHRMYYLNLKKDGLERLNRINMKHYQLKPGLVITFSGQSYNQATITDEISEQVIERFPKLKSHFIIKEDIPVTKTDDNSNVSNPVKKQTRKRVPKSK